MTKTYCDCCGKEFDKWNQTVKYEIKIKDKEKGWFRDLDICDECRKNIELFIDGQFGIKDAPNCSTCKFYERGLGESPCCDCALNNNQWEGKEDDK